jgi:predicted negative regulator of RcsB-dependent stress response
MIATARLSIRCSAVLLGLLIASPALAQTDRLYPQGGDVVLGKIKSISKSGIVMTVSGKDQTFNAGAIEKVMFQGDPTGLTQGREFALDNQFDQAISELKTVDANKLNRAPQKADFAFYVMYSQAQQALSGNGDLRASVTAALNFIKQNTDSWHFYKTAKLLGDLAVKLGSYDQASKYYGSLRNAPSAETKIESLYLNALVKLKQDKDAEAASDLQKIVGIGVQSPEGARLQTLAKAALAIATAKQGKGQEALDIVNELIAKLNPTDTETAAEIYNAQGASYMAMGDNQGALLAYLHTQLMFSTHPGPHSEALKQLAELWTKVGKPDRAAEARSELQQRYPGLSG